MTTPKSPPITSHYPSSSFVESAGAIPFRLSAREICLLYFVERDEYILAKGRRNCGENIRDTAVREVREETGFGCRLVPVRMVTRAPPPSPMLPAGIVGGNEQSGDVNHEVEEVEDIPRVFNDIIEPFHLQIRQIGEKNQERIKIIWWYIAAIDEDKLLATDEDRLQEKRFKVEFYGYEEALKKLTFQSDREVVRNAIEILKATYP